MKSKLFSLAAICSILAIICSLGTRAQGLPDIVWQTNAHARPITAIALSSIGPYLGSTSDQEAVNAYVRIWLPRSDALVKEFALYEEDALCLAFSPDGNYLAVGGTGGENSAPTWRIWRVSDWMELVNSLGGGQGDRMAAVAFSRDSRWEAHLNGRGDLLILFDPKSGLAGGGTDDYPPSGPMTGIAFSPKNETIATGSVDGSVTLWDYTNGLSLEGSLLRNYPGQSAPISAVAFLPDGEQIASASYDSTVVIHRLSDSVITRTLQDSNAIGAMAISPDGKTILTRSTNLKFWRISEGALLQVYDQETQGAGPVAISGDGKYFAYGRSDGVLVLARMPLWIESIMQTNGQITLQWQGGSGVYQVQARNSLNSGSWQNLGGATTNRVFTHICISPMFYRVQSLPGS